MHLTTVSIADIPILSHQLRRSLFNFITSLIGFNRNILHNNRCSKFKINLNLLCIKFY